MARPMQSCSVMKSNNGDDHGSIYQLCDVDDIDNDEITPFVAMSSMTYAVPTPDEIIANMRRLRAARGRTS